MPAQPDTKQEPCYRGNTPDTLPADAIAAFVARYGQQPADVILSGTALLVGPIPETGPVMEEAQP